MVKTKVKHFEGGNEIPLTLKSHTQDVSFKEEEEPTGPSTKPTTTLCSMCEQPWRFICKLCGSSRYCSKTCQVGDRPAHKLLCPTFQKFDVAQAPPNGYRAIHFPEFDEGPRFVWLQVEPGPDGAIDLRKCGFFLRNTWKAVLLSVLSRNEFFHRYHEPIRLVVMGFHKPDGKADMAGEPTKSVRKIGNHMSNFFRGPLLFHIREKHIDMMDFRHIVDSLRLSAWHLYQQELDKTGVEFVRINCLGDVVIGGHHLLEGFKCDPSILSGLSKYAIPVAEKLGLPLLVFDAPDVLSVPWRGRHMRGNPHFTWDMNISHTILNPSQWFQPTGTLFVCRQDFQPLATVEVGALIHYCWWLSKAWSVRPAEDHGSDLDKDRDIWQELDVQYSWCYDKIMNGAKRDMYLQISKRLLHSFKAPIKDGKPEDPDRFEFGLYDGLVRPAP
ncbi:hypothetical protein EK21DRAFT_106534 [Setomelanomma holmii]|uniref:MYND-type domain-containing protein n=1 Tax=Setomelanomma holmii TaxID=210430 RepID=A0A9P4HJT4_9PLEO|nr:hypothetical protein EK21DRAFT_106534 [Setomelanomma holmii]